MDVQTSTYREQSLSYVEIDLHGYTFFIPSLFIRSEEILAPEKHHRNLLPDHSVSMTPSQSLASEWRVGTAEVITPDEPMWMSGYGSRIACRWKNLRPMGKGDNH